MNQDYKTYVDKNLKSGWFARTREDSKVPDETGRRSSTSYRAAYGRLIQIINVYGNYVSFIVVPEEGRDTPGDIYSYHVENLCDFRNEFNVSIFNIVRQERLWDETMLKLRRIYRDKP